MLNALGRANPPKPLARAAPADFHFLRFANISSLFRIPDEVDTWWTPFAGILDNRAEEQDLTARDEAQLGIRRGPLSRALGPDAIESLAVVGSDSYLKEGRDVTLIFRIKSKTLFDAGLASALAMHAKAHGSMQVETKSHEGTDMRIT